MTALGACPACVDRQCHIFGENIVYKMDRLDQAVLSEVYCVNVMFTVSGILKVMISFAWWVHGGIRYWV